MRPAFPMLVMLVGLCACQQPSTESLIENYTKSPGAFAQLSRMIQEDIGKSDCLEVGVDHIGADIANDFWEHSGAWTKNNEYEKKLTLAEVLSQVNISEQRYEEYKKLFKQTNSERVSYCHAIMGMKGPLVRVLVYRAGLAVSGCSGTINWSTALPEAVGERGKGDFVEITPIEKGWYLEFECT